MARDAAARLFPRLEGLVPRLAGLPRADGDSGDAQLLCGRDGTAGAGEGDFYWLAWFGGKTLRWAAAVGLQAEAG